MSVIFVYALLIAMVVNYALSLITMYRVSRQESGKGSMSPEGLSNVVLVAGLVGFALFMISGSFSLLVPGGFQYFEWLLFFMFLGTGSLLVYAVILQRRGIIPPGPTLRKELEMERKPQYLRRYERQALYIFLAFLPPAVFMGLLSGIAPFNDNFVFSEVTGVLETMDVFAFLILLIWHFSRTSQEKKK